jgi:hypothetical protein
MTVTLDLEDGARRFVQKIYRLGVEQRFRRDKALAVADAIEDEELRRKISLQK